MSDTVRIGVIGAGLKAADYARSWVCMPEVQFVAAADINVASRARLAEICLGAGRKPPCEFDDYRVMLAECRNDMDMVYISTPHALHAEQAIAVTSTGLDLLLEKPMVTTVLEAQHLVQAQNKSGGLVVVAFQGALSPLLQDTKARAQMGEFGALVSVAATIWEGWSDAYDGHWKQNPALSGGGFMFDTGAHMMNTVCHLVDSDFERVSAYMNNRGKKVDITCAVSARLKNGVLVTFNASGEGPKGCYSHMTFFYQKAIIRIDAWGGWREISLGNGSWTRDEDEIIDNPIKTFMAVRGGARENPSTVENGLRFARLWDAVKDSATRNGETVLITS